MAIKVGCFALVNPFCTLPKQLEQIQSWGIGYADLTDSTDGGCLGAEYGFTSVASRMPIRQTFGGCSNRMGSL